ncbi:MAG TPA: hypothetical protein ENN85_08150 [Methanoculleus sp.]|nr:hypothetical protein [Methanoculleus sp.]
MSETEESPVHRSLAWTPIGIGNKLHILREGLPVRRARLSPADLHDAQKMDVWIGKIDEILLTIEDIRATVRPQVEADLGFSPGSEEQLILSLFQPSTRNLFAEIEVHFRDRAGCGLASGELVQMAAIPQAAETLAWIGDAALKIGVLSEIWTPEPEEAAVLTERRKAYESNANLALLCDRWQLYEHRIHFDPAGPRADVVHVKGTLVESILGMIFLNGGLRRVARAAWLLRPGHGAEGL